MPSTHATQTPLTAGDYKALEMTPCARHKFPEHVDALEWFWDAEDAGRRVGYPTRCGDHHEVLEHWSTAKGHEAVNTL